MSNEDQPTGSVNQASAEPPAEPRRAASVTECGLELKQVKLLFLFCVPGKESQNVPAATVECTGQLLAESLGTDGFTAEVSWTLAFPDKETAPITISGKHQLVFSIDKPIMTSDATYYSEINAVVLVYPYIRQIIEDLTVKSLGRNVLIPALDVPKWVRQQAARKSLQPSEEAPQGTESDASAGTEEAAGS